MYNAEETLNKPKETIEFEDLRITSQSKDFKLIISLISVIVITATVLILSVFGFHSIALCLDFVLLGLLLLLLIKVILDISSGTD